MDRQTDGRRILGKLYAHMLYLSCVVLEHPVLQHKNKNQRTIGPENAHLKPDLGVSSHNEMTLTFIDFISCLHLQSFWSQAATVSKPSDF